MTGRQTSIQLGEATQQQLDKLRELGFGTQTEVIKVAIDRMYQQECRMIPVELIENYVGRLFIGNDLGPWFDVTTLKADSFADDAAQYARGEHVYWGLTRYEDRPQGDVIGEWSRGVLSVVLSPTNKESIAGISGRLYMGLPRRV